MKNSSIKYIFFSLFIATQLLLAASSQAQPYQTISTQNSIVADDLSRTVTTIQSGTNSLNRFRMTEVRKAGPPAEGLKGVILLLPPPGSGFQNYEASENGDYNNSFVAFFARRNFVVMGYSPRQQGLTAGRAWVWTSDVQHRAVDDVSKRDAQLQAGVWTR